MIIYKTLTPNIMVPNVNATVKWYKDNFNFQLANKTGSLDEELEWAIVRANNVQIFFQKAESLAEEMPILKHKKIGNLLVI